jgi:hypothetical protein
MVGPMPDWRSRYARELRCGASAHPPAAWYAVINASGRHFQFLCPECERPVTKERYPAAPGASVTDDWLRETLGIVASDLPEYRRGLRLHLCYLCGVTEPCEFHHVAPQAIYGVDADKYPIVPLCDACHDAETRVFTERLERYVQERIRRYLARRGGAA